MIIIGKPLVETANGVTRMIADVSIKGNVEKVWIETTEEYGKYFVTDRADAFVVGILFAAMASGQDIKTELPVSGELKFMLEHQLITTLANHSERFHHIKIMSDIINEPIENAGAVCTGLSMGLDSFCTIADTYNTENKSINLTHLLTFNRGILGGFYNNKDYCNEMLYDKIQKVADVLKLPLISVNSNIVSFMSKYFSARVDYFLTYALAMIIMALAKLFKIYYVSSVGLDLAYFSIKDVAFHDCEPYDLFTLYCCTISGGVRFISGGGEKNRFEKMKTICSFDIAKRYLQSCLTEHFNCMNCQKCKRNLVTIDALGCLDDFKEVYDIEYYKKNRNRYLEWMCQQVQMNNHASDYILPAYEIIKKREPKLIESLTVSDDKLIASRNEMQRQRNVYRTYARILRRSLENPDWEQELKGWFERKNIRDIVIYGFGVGTTLLNDIKERIGINIIGVVHNMKPNEKINVPSFPENIVDYPKCDAIIICNVDIPELIQKKLSYFTDVPVYKFEEVLEMKK